MNEFPTPDAEDGRALVGNTPAGDASGVISLAAAPELEVLPPDGKNRRQWDEAMRRLNVVRAYRVACGVGADDSLDKAAAEGRSVNRSEAMRILAEAGIHDSRASLDRYERAFSAGGFAGLFDNAEQAGRPRKHEITDKAKAALKAARLVTNRTETDGSTPEAVRIAARTGALGPELAAELLSRAAAGKKIVPWSLHNDLVAGKAATKFARNPTDAALDYFNAPGALMWITDPVTGEDRFVRVGDILEADDATINFPVCVPWEMGGDACSDRWGVRVARFQWLVAIDRASRFVPGYSYTARPRSSYRGEDVLALFHRIFATHGVWKRLCLERGVWESKKVGEMLRILGIERVTAWSPHQKPFIEGLFNLLWTKLSDMPGQVGRFMGEEEAMNATLTSCRTGATDPRNHFPMLSQAIGALDRACHERNGQPVNSKHWGMWTPEVRWAEQLTEARERARLRPLAVDSSWLFSPEMREWTVKGNTVGGAVRLMDSYSVQFDFSAPWLTEFAGVKVRAHFDPAAPKCEATLVLDQPFRGQKAGEVLGVAWQVNKTANYARRVLGYGDDPDMGNKERKAGLLQLRREVRTIQAGGKIGTAVSEARDDAGNAIVIERTGDGATATPAPDAPAVPTGDRPECSPQLRLVPRRAKDPFAPVDPEVAVRRNNISARVAEALRARAAEEETA